MPDLEQGQVLWMKIRFNNTGDTASYEHPYLILEIDQQMGTVEVAQIDSVEHKSRFKLISRTNKLISCAGETVLYKDSYAQLDNTFKLENCPELKNYRRCPDKLTPAKLQEVLTAYRAYHYQHTIDANKSVYMDKAEILALN